MRFHRRAVAVLAAVAAVLAVVFYPLDEPAPGRLEAASANTVRSLTEREKDLLHDAEELLTRSCMAARGFKVWVVPRNPLAEDRDFPFVVDDVLWASRHGYGRDIQAQRERLRTSDPNRRYFADLSPTEQRRALDALHGRQSAKRLQVSTPNGMTVGRIDDGCVAQAQEELYGDLGVWFRVTTVTDALVEIRQRQVVADTEFTKSIKTWSTCMNAEGFHYADPHEARASFADPDNAVPWEREVRTAVAEARCATSSGLSGTARRLNQRYDDHLRRSYSDEVSTRLRLEIAALERAHSIVQTT